MFTVFFLCVLDSVACTIGIKYTVQQKNLFFHFLSTIRIHKCLSSLYVL